MDWETAKGNMLSLVGNGADINTSASHYRKVERVDEQKGYTVRIGENATIPIPWSMLKVCFDCLASGSTYDGQFFRHHFHREAETHSCYVHAVGMLLVKAGIAMRVDARGYRRAW